MTRLSLPGPPLIVSELRLSYGQAPMTLPASRTCTVLNRRRNRKSPVPVTVVVLGL